MTSGMYSEVRIWANSRAVLAAFSPSFTKSISLGRFVRISSYHVTSQ